MLARRIFLLAGATLIPGLVSISYFELSLRHEREQELNATVLRNTKQAVSEIAQILGAIKDVLHTASLAAPIQVLDKGSCSDFLKKVQDNKPAISALGAADLTGEVKCSTVPFDRASITDRAYFKEALRTRSFVVGEYLQGLVTGLPRLPVASPIHGANGEPLGIVYGALSLDWLQKHIEQRGLESGSALTISDRNGIILARDPLPERFIGTPIPENFMHLVRAETEGTIKLTSQDGTERLIAYVPPAKTGIGLYVSSGVSKNVAFRLINRSSIATVLITLLSTTFAVFLAWFLAHRLIRQPIVNMLGALDGWRNGRGSRTRMGRGAGELAALGASLDEMMDEIDAREAKQKLAAAEMVHRLKNALTIVHSICRQSLKSIPGAEKALAGLQGRIVGLSRAYDFLISEDPEDLSIEAVLRSALLAFEGETPSITFEGPALTLHAKAAYALTLIAHELATNAVKYGALSTPAGRVRLNWNLKEDHRQNWISVTWEEHGGPPVTPPSRDGFGSELIKSAFAPEFRASMDRTFQASGLFLRMTFLQHPKIGLAA